jgi:hypothetical protein
MVSRTTCGRSGLRRWSRRDSLAQFAFPHAPSTRGDAVAHLVNVTVRPGYNFADAGDALAYGTGVCDKVAQGRGYAEVIGEVKPDSQAADEFRASCLISQAVNELCPALIWQLRNSAAHY